ncbi:MULTISPECIES: hypothetical protein [unclassified Uliginosibacterium]|uniref:hypothetical protein n=1 Tax=unclassified Uliginosibacterium TaxID=2621521 RepID=UPI000C7DB435|nr:MULTISPECIES: hypothetical protein [unclassified Uliginosibacterium]MDO6385534.1 hypothetical protein [Uliginosibacterium sp. 31-12]PLK47575.1 hypothetical protein C0V76_16445 [Uliginosibacterium sp. TH139]
MRTILVASLFLLTAACASSPETKPVAATAPAAPVVAAPAAPKAPECYNGDLGSFQAVGTVATVSGVKVQCKLTSDGKGASWNTAK